MHYKFIISMVNKKLIRPIIKVGLMSDLQQILNTFGDLVGKCMHVFLSTVTLHIFKHSSLSSQTIAEVSDCMFCSIYSGV